jgi:hypothetical protein
LAPPQANWTAYAAVEHALRVDDRTALRDLKLALQGQCRGHATHGGQQRPPLISR